MAHVQDRFTTPRRALLALLPNRVVTRTAAASGPQQDAVWPAATKTERPFGMIAGASVAASTMVTVYEEGSTVKAVAAASLGPGAVVGVASTNGALGPVSAASGVSVWAVGDSESPADAGETFSVYIKPRQLSILA